MVAAERPSQLSAGEVEVFISQLEGLPIKFDTLTAYQAFSRILGMSRIYNLSSYDAAYLELAVREGLPIASLDKDVIKAAKKAGVDIYLR